MNDNELINKIIDSKDLLVESREKRFFHYKEFKRLEKKVKIIDKELIFLISKLQRKK